jgi:hypothetical protein
LDGATVAASRWKQTQNYIVPRVLIREHSRHDSIVARLRYTLLAQAFAVRQSFARGFHQGNRTDRSHLNRREIGRMSHHRHHESGAGNLVALFATCFWLVRSGVHPNEFEPRAWYDRTIRVVGGILILIVFGASFVLLILDKFKK